jgi:hypothetical protein
VVSCLFRLSPLIATQLDEVFIGYQRIPCTGVQVREGFNVSDEFRGKLVFPEMRIVLAYISLMSSNPLTNLWRGLRMSYCFGAVSAEAAAPFFASERT